MANISKHNMSSSTSSDRRSSSSSSGGHRNTTASAYIVNSTTNELTSVHFGAGGMFMLHGGYASIVVADSVIQEWGGWFEVANPNNTTPPPSPGKHRGRRAQRQAAHYITEECERLFCGTLEAVFLVEKGTGLSEPLVMDAHNEEQRSRKTGPRHDYAVKASGPAGSVTDWLEVYDYHGDGVRFRGFVAESPKQRAMFVFFDKNVVAGQDLKPGLTALLELASSDGVDCDQLIVCVDRTADETAAKDLTKDLGWVGFELTILDDWSGQKCTLSDRWLFLGMDV